MFSGRKIRRGLLDKSVVFWAGGGVRITVLEKADGVDLSAISRNGFSMPVGIDSDAKANATGMAISHVGALLISGSCIFIAFGGSIWRGIRTQFA